MSESIPLRAALCIHAQPVIVHRHRRSVQYLMLKALSAECRMGWHIKGQIERYSMALPNLACCGGHGLLGQKIKHSQLVMWAPQAPSIAGRSILVQRQLIERRELAIGC